MRAVAFDVFGDQEVLHVTDLPEPEAGPGHVVVKVAAATINPTDVMMRVGKQAALMTGLRPPFVAGMEFSGHVHALGAAVSGFRLGQAVMGLVNPRRPERGAHAQYVVVPEASIAAVPDGVDLVAAATLPMNGVTALMSLDMLGLRPGDALLVTGAAGAVGGYVSQIGRSQGLRVVADAGPSDESLVRALGASDVVPRGEGLAAAVRVLFPQGVDGLLDAALLGRAASALVRDGGVAVALRRANPIDDPRLRCLYVSVTEGMADTAKLVRLGELVRTGQLTPRIARTLRPDEAAEGHRLVEGGGLRGRVMLVF